MKLTKPWDVAVLAESLKADGLDLAEDALKKVLDKSMMFVEESVKLSENKFDDLVLLALPQIREEAMKAIDKIDGVKG